MEVVTLAVDERVKEKFFWLLDHFDESEVQRLSDSDEQVLQNLQQAVNEVNSGSLDNKKRSLGQLIDEL